FGPFAVMPAMAQTAAPTVESIRNDILSGLAAPLAITVIGPLIVQNVDVTETGDGFRVMLESPLLMGIVPLEAISFTLTPEGEQLRVSDFTLPGSVPLFGAAVLEIGSTDVTGLWSPAERSYSDLQFALGDLQVRTLGGQSMQVDLDRLALAVDQQGTIRADGSVADNSLLRIEAAGVQTQGLPENDVTLDRLFAELKANGEEPVDLYAIVSRFVLLSAMQGDQSAALRFFDSLRARDYALLSLELGGQGLSVQQTGAASGTLDVANINASLGLEDATPQAWREMMLAVEGQGIVDAGFSDRAANMSFESASSVLRGSDIPIGGIIEAAGLMMAADAGAEVEIDLGGLMDGLIGFESISLETSAQNISIESQRRNAPGFALGNYGGEIRIDGLGGDGEGAGLFALAQGADGIELKLPPQADANQAKIQEIFLPRAFNYDVALDGLQLPLLRQLSEGAVIPAGSDPIELAAPLILWFTALKPKLLVEDTFFDGAGFGFSTQSDLTFYPAWSLSFPPYEGTSYTELRGLENLKELIRDGLGTPAPGPDATPRARREWRNQQEALRFAISAINAMVAIADSEGTGADRVDSWNLNLPDARGQLIKINGIEFRIPDFLGMVMPMAMGGVLR
ncbi:MAG: hypothetical protein AAGH82_07150, partial [Pseudomonadota bacterium]